MGDQLMKPIAKQLGVKEPKEPSKKDKQLIAKLEGLSGPQFDEEYIKAMVKDHQQDLREFKDAAKMAQDPNVKQAAQQGAGMIFTAPSVDRADRTKPQRGDGGQIQESSEYAVNRVRINRAAIVEFCAAMRILSPA